MQLRMTLDKHYHRDLDASGQGRSLTGMTDVKGSAAYVAIERWRQAERSRRHISHPSHGSHDQGPLQSLVIRVVPDSGTGDLDGIEGEMHIKIADGKHFYRFEYTLGSSTVSRA